MIVNSNIFWRESSGPFLILRFWLHQSPVADSVCHHSPVPASVSSCLEIGLESMIKVWTLV